jgi:two-component system, NtrC family, nitrogen regulation response regulator GlnG
MATVSNFPVLIIDDEAQYLQSAAVALRLAGYDVDTLQDPKSALETVKNRLFGAILLDILMPGIRGDILIDSIVSATPLSAIIMVTALNDIETAVACMRKGAFDYLLKPVEKDRLVTTVKRAIEMIELRSENRRLKESLLKNHLRHPEYFEGIVTRDSQMIAAFRYIEAIASTPMPVLIRGETGTGKELMAHAVHRASGRSGELVCVNAAGMTDVLFNDILFGHEKGAFTGAEVKRAGLVSKASGGTLFLDEIGDMALESQIKLLRLLEERTYYPIGSDTPRTSDARIIAATNCDLDSARREGKFRNDLYYRLEAHVIDIPPLRQHQSDIPLLIDHFAELAAQQLKRSLPVIKNDFYDTCSLYSFPGNIRELRNVVTDAISILDGPYLDSAVLPSKFTQGNHSPDLIYSTEFNRESLKQWQSLPCIKDVEDILVNEALRRSNGNQTIAAQLLGMTRSALNKRLIRAKQE